MTANRKLGDVGFTRNDTGFSVQFANGYGLSVQWSHNHICSLYHGCYPTAEFSPTAECCEINPNGNRGKVWGHCSPDTVLKLMRRVQRKQTEAERDIARQCRIEAQQRKHGWQNTPEFEPREQTPAERTAFLDKQNEERDT